MADVCIMNRIMLVHSSNLFVIHTVGGLFRHALGGIILPRRLQVAVSASQAKAIITYTSVM